MCLILFSFHENPEIPFILAANRDEFFNRPTAAAHYWEDQPELLAGRDLVGGGTWLGITRNGRFAAITNVREPSIVVENALSRGELTRDFLTGQQSPQEYLQAVEEKQMLYNGFNLLVGELTPESRSLWYLSNRQRGIQALSSGVYGLSNHLLDSHWPKVDEGKQFISTAIEQHTETSAYHQQLRRFLEDPALAADDKLPATGVSIEREKALSAAYIQLPGYGTRASTVLTITGEQTIFSEKEYLLNGQQHNSTQSPYREFILDTPTTAQAASNV